MSKEPANCSSGLLSLLFGPFIFISTLSTETDQCIGTTFDPRDSISAERAENRSRGAQEDADQERQYADPALAHGASQDLSKALAHLVVTAVDLAEHFDSKLEFLTLDASAQLAHVAHDLRDSTFELPGCRSLSNVFPGRILYWWLELWRLWLHARRSEVTPQVEDFASTQPVRSDLPDDHCEANDLRETADDGRPFLYFPLRHHFEQNFHVRHRLERYGAGRRMDFDHSPPERIAAAIAEEIGREVDYLPVERDGARRAAERLAEML
jgi:hypothetical protein